MQIMCQKCGEWWYIDHLHEYDIRDLNDKMFDFYYKKYKKYLKENRPGIAHYLAIRDLFNKFGCGLMFDGTVCKR